VKSAGENGWGVGYSTGGYRGGRGDVISDALQKTELMGGNAGPEASKENHLLRNRGKGGAPASLGQKGESWKERRSRKEGEGKERGEDQRRIEKSHFFFRKGSEEAASPIIGSRRQQTQQGSGGTAQVTAEK